jgi:hypothetical protein
MWACYFCTPWALTWQSNKWLDSSKRKESQKL